MTVSSMANAAQAAARDEAFGDFDDAFGSSDDFG